MQKKINFFIFIVLNILAFTKANTLTEFGQNMIRTNHDLFEITHTLDRLLSQKRNEADSFKSIVNRFLLSILGNSIAILQDYQLSTRQFINETCESIELRNHFETELQRNASEAGDAISECGQQAYREVQAMTSENFYDYYLDLQRQSISIKHIILFPFLFFHPIDNQEQILWISEETVDQTIRTLNIYVQPEIDAEVRSISNRGQYIINAVTSCAYAAPIQFSQAAHSIRASVQEQCSQ